MITADQVDTSYRGAKGMDITGMLCLQLKALEYVGRLKRDLRIQLWLAECSCGNVFLIRKDNITLRRLASCGCTTYKLPSFPIKLGKTGRTNRPGSLDITGRVFNDLTAIRYLGDKFGRNSASHDREIWECSCVCGKIVMVEKYRLLQLKVLSCGCHSDKRVASRRVAYAKIIADIRGRPKCAETTKEH